MSLELSLLATYTIFDAIGGDAEIVIAASLCWMRCVSMERLFASCCRNAGDLRVTCSSGTESSSVTPPCSSPGGRDTSPKVRGGESGRQDSHRRRFPDDLPLHRAQGEWGAPCIVGGVWYSTKGYGLRGEEARREEREWDGMSGVT